MARTRNTTGNCGFASTHLGSRKPKDRSPQVLQVRPPKEEFLYSELKGLRLVLGFEGGNGFDEAGHGEGVAHAALADDEVQAAAEARQGDGKFHEDGDAGTVNLGNVVEVDDDFAGALLHQILHEFE